MAFLLSVGYFFFLFPSERLPNKAQHTTFFLNFTETYPSAFKQEIEKSATEITSTAKTLTRERHFSRPAGHLNVHMWNGICGTKVDVLRYWPHFPYFPDDHSFISDFQKTQVPTRKNKGERVFGFIHPQKSGEYKFALTASNDGSELWLSPNEDPASSEMIACGYFSYGSDYNRYPEQISKEITLLAGKKYYIESLIKQGHGLTAHVAVYWSYNSSTFEIISSKYLSSFYVNNNESVPPHAGIKRNNSLLQKKSNFHNLPFINKREYRSNIPTCLYNPSFLVRNKLKRYQGIVLTIESHVFPQDDTDMIENFGNWRKRNQLIDKNIAESVVDKLMKSLSSR